MKISDAAAAALVSAVSEANARLERKRNFGVAAVPSRGVDYLDVFLLRIRQNGRLEVQKEKRSVTKKLVPIRIQELLKGTPLHEIVVFLHWQEGERERGWRFVNSDLNPIDLDGAPFSVPYKD